MGGMGGDAHEVKPSVGALEATRAHVRAAGKAPKGMADIRCSKI